VASACVAWVALWWHHDSVAWPRAVLARHGWGLLVVERMLGLVRRRLPLWRAAARLWVVPLIVWQVGGHLVRMRCALTLSTSIPHLSLLRALILMSWMCAQASLVLLASWRWLHAASVRVGGRTRVRLLVVTASLLIALVVLGRDMVVVRCCTLEVLLLL